MIFDNIDFHNVEEMEKCDKGYILWRVPGSLRRHLSKEAAERASRYNTGVELRFKMKSDKVKVVLRAEPIEEAQVAYIYHGTFQGGWMNSSKVILQEDTVIEIEKPAKLSELQEIAGEHNLGFDPAVVRIVMPYGLNYYVGVEGEVEPPEKEETPRLTYLAYGSSITHGSLGLASPFSYVFRISQLLHCDYINMGYAGLARLEEEMAEYLCERKDWDFATLELGINMLSDEFDVELFESRMKRFAEIMAADGRPVFVTDIYGFNDKWQQKADRYREIVKKYASDKLIYVSGLDLLSNPAFVSADMIHPTAEGQLQIADRWAETLRQRLFPILSR